MIATDMALLVIILAGLLVSRRNGGSTFGLSRLLWRQGVIWLALGSAIKVPPLVLSSLHLNDQIHSLFEVPCIIAMTIAATRMHRSLVDFACGPTEVTHENCTQMCLVFSRAKRRTDTVPTTRDQISGSVNLVFDQRSTGPKNDGDTSTVFSTSGQIPQIAGDPSKLDLTQESAHPPPTVPSPVFEAESV